MTSLKEGSRICTVLIAGIAVARLMLAIVPDRFFDVDPISVPFFFAGIGPSLSVLLDGLLVLASAVGLELERRRRGLDPWLLLLVMLPLVPIAWHGMRNVPDFWRGMDWFAAIMSAAALAHLARCVRCRELALALLIGGIAATAVRGGWQFFVEHPETVRHFEEHREEVLGMQGWSVDSTAAQVYERRLRQPEATGWIGFSNVTSGLYGAGAMALLGLLIFSSHGREHRGTQLGLLGFAAVLIGLVILNGSKGAIAATGLGLLMLVGLRWRGGIGDWFGRNAGRVVIGLALLAIIAVVARGMLPVGFAGEKSLLFRWHYLQGAAGMVLEEPLLGVGPDGFQDAFERTRPADNPESPASAHSAWIDWLASLGAWGAAWIGVMGLLFLRREEGTKEEEVESPGSVRAGLLAGLASYSIIVAMQLVVEWPVLDEMGAVMRLVGGLVAVCVLLLVLDAFSRGFPRAGWYVAISAAVVIVAQGQIEMLFWQPGSMVIAWAFLGLAGTAVARSRSTAAVGWPLGVGAIAVVMLIGGSLLLLRESAVRRVAMPLQQLGMKSSSPTMAEIEEARWNAGKALANQMPEAGGWWDGPKVKAATSQLGSLPDPKDRQHALDIADDWFAARPGAGSSSLRASLARGLHMVSEDPATLRQAIEMTGTAIEFRPLDPLLRLRLAELLLADGLKTEALQEINEAERLNANLGLDPLVQFTPAQQKRLEELRATAQSS